MRIGVFGGTFDPIHLGHLVIAEQAREQAALDEVWFLPSSTPPHKRSQPLTPFDRRADMIELAIAGNRTFRLERIELEREGPSYTADTLSVLHERHPHSELFWLIGSDCLPDLPTWYQPQRIIAQATLLVATRPDWPMWTTEQLRDALKLPADAPIRMQVVNVPQVDFASRDIRRRIASGMSVRYMLPNGVLAYIQDKGLYRS
jgi:nicotinate-nucleotide adenylyltransferase